MKSKIVDLVSKYVDGDIGIAQFAEVFADLYVESCLHGDARSKQMCGAIMGPFAEYSRGDRSVESFRRELENAIRPVVIMIHVGMPEPHTYRNSSPVTTAEFVR